MQKHAHLVDLENAEKCAYSRYRSCPHSRERAVRSLLIPTSNHPLQPPPWVINSALETRLEQRGGRKRERDARLAVVDLERSAAVVEEHLLLKLFANDTALAHPRACALQRSLDATHVNTGLFTFTFVLPFFA